jgi:hypothetical protein
MCAMALRDHASCVSIGMYILVPLASPASFMVHRQHEAEGHHHGVIQTTMVDAAIKEPGLYS